MHDANRVPAFIQREDAGDRARAVVHDAQGLRRQHIGADGLGMGVHDVGGAGVVQILFQRKAQVAVGNQADQPVALIHNAHAAEGLAGHFHNDLPQRHGGMAQRHAVAAVHQFLHTAQLRPQPAPGMENAEIIGAEPPTLQQHDGQRIAQRKLHGGTGGGGQADGAGFGRVGKQQPDIRRAGQRGVRARCHGDQQQAEPAGMGNDVRHFRRLARIGNGKDRITLLQHAQIPMRGFRRMHENRRRAGGSQRRLYLAPDMPRLANAGHDHAHIARQDALDHLDEGGAKSLLIGRGRGFQCADHGVQARGFRAQHVACLRQHMEMLRRGAFADIGGKGR